ncbi:hypothetical protein [Singulisphaera acidiphila]|uniref:Uncharacterized protein n=1 Tax=Singulisphaera acidiphila (strain ATCC BAA-1392 / DSM 18658 / VKM B-2454 / MOB10) TaxID=886293 RepID=L0DEQ3_SINAD|nr:hypothetical protein [Singulisphaera acidiphila]AGA27298.1 hypothetical protein Sinac_3015 [Singulisphaera acidiphila DSM 18658]
MHQLILLTALTATSGLFGGGRQQCGTGRCGRPTVGFSACAPQQQYAQPQFSACQPGTACGTAAPAAYPAYAPQAPIAAPQAYAPAPQAAAYPSYYYPTAASSCAGGSCARR